MHEEMRNVQDTRALMESAGFRLQNVLEPGIYVRRAELIEKDPIDWKSEPTELLREIEQYMERYRAQGGGVD
jgi:hypothetical protein